MQSTRIKPHNAGRKKQRNSTRFQRRHPLSTPCRHAGMTPRGVSKPKSPNAASAPTIRQVYQPRNTKTGIIGAGVSGITAARVSQVLGYSSPITLIDMVPPARVSAQNKKRNHPVMLSSSSLDALAQLDPALYRRLLSLGRFDTRAGYLDWFDRPEKMFMPKIPDDVIFPRWINHLGLPRDAYTFAVLTTPLHSIADKVKQQLVAQGKPLPELASVSINLGKIVKVQTPRESDPTWDPSAGMVPIVKVYPAKNVAVSSHRSVSSPPSNNNSSPASSSSPSTSSHSDLQTTSPNSLSETASRRAVEFNTILAADGIASEIWAQRHGLHNNPLARFTAPSEHRDVRIHGWVPTSALNMMIGKTINDTPFTTWDHVFARINSRVWTRHTPGIRFTTFLMDYAPLHLTEDMQYRPKQSNDAPGWIYWELLVAGEIWQRETPWGLPISPAVNNWTPPLLDLKHTDPTEALMRDMIEDLDTRGLKEAVSMIPNSAGISGAKITDSISILRDHPLVNVLVSETQPEAMTIESSGYNPLAQIGPRGSVFDDHVMYIGDAAYGITNDTFLADTHAFDQGLVAALALATNSTAPPETLSQRFTVLQDATLRGRTEFLQRRTNEVSAYYGEPSKWRNSIARKIEQQFPARDTMTDYEQLYRYNPLTVFESRASQQISNILARNMQYRDSLRHGFLDGETRQVEFGDVPLDKIELGNIPLRPRPGVGIS